MKEPIQTSSDEVSIVIYDAPLPPKYFRLKKSFIKTFLVTAPLLVIILIISFFLWGLGSRIKQIPTPTMPIVMSDSESKITALKAENKSLTESVQELSEKIANLNSVTNAEDPYLLVIKKPYGMQNLLPQNKVNLDQFKLTHKENSLQLNFQIISSSPERKVTGHVIVFMLSETGLLAYPKEANTTIGNGVKYTSGESFSVSRLRPTSAVFAGKAVGESVKFLIYIFSREGDLLLIRETENFKVGPKS